MVRSRSALKALLRAPIPSHTDRVRFCLALARTVLNMPKLKRTHIRPIVVASLALAIVPVVSGCGGGGSKSSTSAAASPAVAATVPELKNLQSSLRHPIYWAGAKSGFTYELTQTRNGNIYVRYLPAGVQVGDNHPTYLTVGTYPQVDAFKQVETAGRRKGASKSRLPGGGLAVQNSSHPNSVYMAFPKSSLLIEVFDPSAKVARSLVRSGQVQPLG